MKNKVMSVAIFLCFALIFVVSCANDYDTVDEKGVSFVNLSISLSEEVAVPDGTVLVTYGASRNGTDTVSATLNDSGTSATARLDEYFANSSGKFTKLSFSVKKADGTEIPVKASVSSIKADKDGASVSLSAKESKSSGAGENDLPSGDSDIDFDDDSMPYLPVSYRSREVRAWYSFFDPSASRYSEVSDVSPDKMKGKQQVALYAFFFFADGTFLMTEKNFYFNTETDDFDITLFQLVKGTYTGSPEQDGAITMEIAAANIGDDDENENGGAEWDESFIKQKICDVSVSGGEFKLMFRDTFVMELLSTNLEEWIFERH